MTKLILIAMTLLIYGSASSQDNSLLSYEVADIGALSAGDTMMVKLNLNLQPGWYIYAPTALNRAQDMQVMKLKFNPQPGVLRQWGELKMPVAQLSRNHEVFSGNDNWFYQRFIVARDVMPGEYSLTVQLQYQACSSNICYPPVIEKINIPFTVSQGGLPAAQVISRAAATAKKENKKAFIMFHSSWCVWCKKMDAAMQDSSCRELFKKNYVIEHLTVFESDTNKNKENPGADELLKKLQPPHSGIPFWLIFDGDGRLIADSQIRPPGASLQTPGSNMGCPTKPEEVTYFINILRKTSTLNEDDLSIIAKVFESIK